METLEETLTAGNSVPVPPDDPVGGRVKGSEESETWIMGGIGADGQQEEEKDSIKDVQEDRRKKDGIRNNPARNNNSKMDRKNARKWSKMGQVVARQVGVNISSNPNQWLVVWGIGVASGIGKAAVLEYFRPPPIEVRLFVDQTYVFIRCSDEESATQLKETYHGSSFDEKQTLYIGFVDKVDVIPEENLGAIRPFHEAHPEGLLIFPEFISPEEEACIIKELYFEGSKCANLKKRTVQHFGYEFRYGTNDVDSSSPLPQNIPDYIMPVVSRMVSSGAISAEPDQLTVNQYCPGQGIPPHCDTHSCFEGSIVSLSLGSDIVMDFRQAESISSLILPARSLLRMSNESRYGWTHGITPRKWDVIPDRANGGLTVLSRQLRISLTFRRLNRGDLVCRCKFPTLCDSQQGKITSENASTLEDDLVHKVYEEIAAHFTETRHKPWPKIKEFVEWLSPGAFMLDVGCANGKYFGINKDIIEVGIDMSTGLLMKCHEKGHDVLRANALALPFNDNCFDGVISIAVLHHIATKERRLRFLEEIVRVMKPGGLGLVYVWAKEQKLDDAQSNWSERQSEKKYNPPPDTCLSQAANYSFLPVHRREIEFPENDMLVPWVNNQDSQRAVHHRYYHVFDNGELDELIMTISPPVTIVHQYYEQGNWVVKFLKPS